MCPINSPCGVRTGRLSLSGSPVGADRATSSQPCQLNRRIWLVPGRHVPDPRNRSGCRSRLIIGMVLVLLFLFAMSRARNSRRELPSFPDAILCTLIFFRGFLAPLWGKIGNMVVFGGLRGLVLPNTFFFGGSFLVGLFLSVLIRRRRLLQVLFSEWSFLALVAVPRCVVPCYCWGGGGCR